MKQSISMAFAAIATLSACAEYPDRVDAAYIPSIVYKGASCHELARERGKLAEHVNTLVAKQRNAAYWDTAMVATGTFISWPALAGLPFTKDQHAQLSVAKGHYDALMEAGRGQGCGDAYYQRPTQDPYTNHQRGDFPPI
jgi:hypothetical protein